MYLRFALFLLFLIYLAALGLSCSTWELNVSLMRLYSGFWLEVLGTGNTVPVLPLEMLSI